MANYLSEQALRRQYTPTSGMAGDTVTQVIDYTVVAPAPVAADFIEIGYLPAGNRLLGFEVISAGTGAATIEVGTMTGDAGDALDTARVFTGPRILPAASTATATATRADCLKIVATGGKDLPIGIKPSAALTVGGKITVVATYAAA